MATNVANGAMCGVRNLATNRVQVGSAVRGGPERRGAVSAPAFTSQDDTEEVARSHGVTYLRGVFKGPSGARNAGLAVTTTYYVNFLDDDDEWLPHNMEAQLVVHHGDFDVLIPSHSRIGKVSGGTRIAMLLGTPG